MAVLGSYVQELELYKQGLEETEAELNKYNKAYSDNTKAYYESLGIHSEQEYYDKTEELINQQYDFSSAISDTENSIVDMYESSIDAIDEYIQTLIDGYSDYISSVKEALDSEKELFEFKKNVQKQSKDIAELERKIASLSGSTNKSEIAERRKLEAQLYEAREGLNDTYYDHSKDALNNALDEEQSAYEETMNKFVEGMRTSLETATQDMDTFLGKVTTMVSLNAGVILEQYRQTELPLDDALTNPWGAAKEAVGNYSGDALELMNTWAQNGFLTTFPETVKGSLTSPWTAGQTAVEAFTTTVGVEMGKVVSAIETNVKSASGELSSLYQQIIDTANEAAELGGGGDSPFNILAGAQAAVNANKVPLYSLMQTSREMILGPKSFVDANTETINGVKYYRDSNTGYYYKISDLNSNRKYDGGRTTGWAIPKGTWFYTKNGNGTTYRHAKGTTGVPNDELAIVDELGPELIMHANPATGRLEYLTKGSSVIPHDATVELLKLADVGVNGLMDASKFGANINMISNAVNKPEFNISFDALVKAENITEETLPAVRKLVTQELNRFTKELNYALKGKGAR